MPQTNNNLHFTIEQFQILLDLYKSSFSKFDSLNDLYEKLTRAIAIGLKVSRASIWFFEGEKLVCEKLYSNESYHQQFELHQKDHPNYFTSIRKGLALLVNEAQQDSKTIELKDKYLIPLGIKSLLDVPIRQNGELIGIFCCEEIETTREWNQGDVSFAMAITDLLNLFVEEQRKLDLENSLFENQDRFKFISENISDGIYIVENGKLVFTSKKYLEIIGLTFNDIQQLKNADMFHLVHPDDLEMVKSIILDAVKNKLQSVKYSFRCEKRGTGYIWREDVMNLHYDFTGNPYRAVVVARDITLEKQKEIIDKRNKELASIQNKLLLDLYSSQVDRTFTEKIQLVTNVAVEGLFIDRASYWEVKDNKLLCKDLYDKSTQIHSDTLELNVRKIPKYIHAINTKTALIADDVYTNKHTEELIDNYLKPLGITDMLDIPVRVNAKVYGVLCCEHRDDPRVWSENDISFARALADYLSLAIEQEKRMIAEIESKENQQKLEFISQNTSDGIVIFENRIITYVSPAFAKLSGYSIDFIKSITGENALQFLHPDDYDRIFSLIYSNLENKVTNFNYEYRFLCADNNYYWREDSISVIYKSNENEYSKYILITRDIQKRKEAELELKEKEQRLRLIFENSTDGFLVIENHEVKYISPSYRNMLGFEESEIVNFPTEKIFEIIHPEDSQKFRDFIFENLKNQNTNFSAEFRIKSKDGKYHWREDLANVIYGEDGKYLTYIVTSRNIEERKAMQEELVESDKQLKLIMDNTSDGVVVLENGKLTYVSPAYLKFLGIKNNDYTQMSIDDIFDKMHPEDVESVKKTIFEGLSSQKREMKYEHRYRGGDGQYHWREDSANVIYDENGHYTKYIVITRDISSRKESEKEKNRLYQITQKQNEKLINFTHIVSHDIRSHTSNIAMILELYEEAISENEKEEYFTMLKQSATKLSDTIFFLNETVAVQSGLKSEKTVINIKTDIEKIILGLNAIILTNKVEININIEPSLQIETVQSYFESMVFNLLTNAIKYRSPDRYPIIEIRATRKREEIEISITDNGIGIDLEKNKNKIFGMYKTFAGNPDAVGLGLFMVKNHIEALGGRVVVESQINVGTTFKLYFV